MDGELKTNWLPVELAIRRGINRSTGRTYGSETRRTRSVKVIGNGQPARVVWSELYVTGRATVEVNGARKVIPFEFREDFDLVVEAVGGSSSSAGSDR